MRHGTFVETYVSVKISLESHCNTKTFLVEVLHSNVLPHMFLDKGDLLHSNLVPSNGS